MRARWAYRMMRTESAYFIRKLAYTLRTISRLAVMADLPSYTHQMCDNTTRLCIGEITHGRRSVRVGEFRQRLIRRACDRRRA